MQLKSLAVILILAFPFFAQAQNRDQSKKIKQSQTQTQKKVSSQKIKRSPTQVMNELSDFAGEYDLESGQTRYCPHGFFRIGEDFIVIGANIRIPDINKGVVVRPKSPQSSCSVRREATLNGKKIQFNRTETCDNTTSSSDYELELSETEDGRKIHLRAKRNTESLQLKKSTLEFECIYIRNLKLM